MVVILLSSAVGGGGGFFFFFLGIAMSMDGTDVVEVVGSSDDDGAGLDFLGMLQELQSLLPLIAKLINSLRTKVDKKIS